MDQLTRIRKARHTTFPNTTIRSRDGSAEIVLHALVYAIPRPGTVGRSLQRQGVGDVNSRRAKGPPLGWPGVEMRER